MICDKMKEKEITRQKEAVARLCEELATACCFTYRAKLGKEIASGLRQYG